MMSYESNVGLGLEGTQTGSSVFSATTLGAEELGQFLWVSVAYLPPLAACLPRSPTVVPHSLASGLAGKPLIGSKIRQMGTQDTWHTQRTHWPE